MFSWLSKLLGGSDEVSSNRFIGILAFALFVYVVISATRGTVTNEPLLIKSMEYVFFIIVSALGLKGVEKVVSVLKSKKDESDEGV